jgi:hypothetical protein
MRPISFERLAIFRRLGPFSEASLTAETMLAEIFIVKAPALGRFIVGLAGT